MKNAFKVADGRTLQFMLGAMIANGLLIGLADAEPPAAFELEGYTEPFRTINVAADEMGIVAELLVREGEAVRAGQPLARLNSDVHLGLLAIAEQNMLSQGRLDAARAELRLRAGVCRNFGL